MNREFPMLRQLGAAQRHRHDVAAWLDQHGIMHTATTPPQCPCLRLRLHSPNGVVQVLVEANGWAKANCPPLEGGAWELIPAQTLRALVASCSNTAALPPALSGGATAICIELVTPADGDALPSIHSALGTAWIESIQSAQGAVDGATNPLIGSGLSLELRLASLSLSPDLVAGLGRNDVLRLGALPARGGAWLGEHLIHTFIFKDNHVEIDSNLLLQENSAASASQQAEISLGSLSITLEVVLAHLPITLDGLQALGKGSVLELPPSAHLNVRVRDAGRLLAIGELVHIGDQLGVQLRSMATSA